MKYKIHWINKITGATGCGTKVYPREVAQRYADELNAQKDSICTHFIKAEEQTMPKETNGQ